MNILKKLFYRTNKERTYKSTEGSTIQWKIYGYAIEKSYESGIPNKGKVWMRDYNNKVYADERMAQEAIDNKNRHLYISGEYRIVPVYVPIKNK